MIDFLFPKLHKEGYRFLAIAAVITFILLLISNFLGLVSFILTVWVYYFFRDPERFPISDENYLLSPADGIISQIIETNGPSEIGGEKKKYTRVDRVYQPSFGVSDGKPSLFALWRNQFTGFFF